MLMSFWVGPFRVAQLVRTLIRDLRQVSAVDIAIGLAEVLPSGLYSEAGIERYVRTILSDPDRTDDFRLLQNELYLAATDLDTCERIVFGAEGWDDVPISRPLTSTGSSRPRTSTSRSRPARSSSSWSTRWCRSSTTSPRRSRRCSELRPRGRPAAQSRRRA